MIRAHPSIVCIHFIRLILQKNIHTLKRSEEIPGRTRNFHRHVCNKLSRICQELISSLCLSMGHAKLMRSSGRSLFSFELNIYNWLNSQKELKAIEISSIQFFRNSISLSRSNFLIIPHSTKYTQSAHSCPAPVDSEYSQPYYGSEKFPARQ